VDVVEIVFEMEKLFARHSTPVGAFTKQLCASKCFVFEEANLTLLLLKM
jgi:hypothetical protein